MAVILTLATEAICFAATFYLANFGVIYRPASADYEQYIAARDPVLGWPSSTPNLKKPTDNVGARLSPGFPDRDQTTPKVSVYGDSFSWSSGVQDQAAWPEVLSAMIEGRVDNFGVGGYGTDQALLRCQKNRRCGIEKAPVVVLMHLTENILRNVNQYRNLIYGGNGYGLKPRFIVQADGALKHIPLPKIPISHSAHFNSHPENYLPHEAFFPEGELGPTKCRFPFSLTLVRTLNHFHLEAKFKNEPRHKAFYQPAHKSNGLEVTVGIIQQFHLEAQEWGQTPIIVLLPTLGDFEYHKRTNHWTYTPLVQALNARGIPILDLGPRMLKRFGDAPASNFYGTTNPHHNEKGYRLVAELVHSELCYRQLCD